jgi:hypothetical protein
MSPSGNRNSYTVVAHPGSIKDDHHYMFYAINKRTGQRVYPVLRSDATPSEVATSAIGRIVPTVGRVHVWWGITAKPEVYSLARLKNSKNNVHVLVCDYAEAFYRRARLIDASAKISSPDISCKKSVDDEGKKVAQRGTQVTQGCFYLIDYEPSFPLSGIGDDQGAGGSGEAPDTHFIEELSHRASPGPPFDGSEDAGSADEDEARSETQAHEHWQHAHS